MELQWRPDAERDECEWIHELNTLFGEKPSNTFLLKLSYRIGVR